MPYPVLISSTSFGCGAEPDQLMDLFSQHSLMPTFLPLEKAIDQLDQFVGMIIGTSKLSRQLLLQAKQLRVIVKYGVGTDNIDRETATERGIKVINFPGINAESVAELALGLMLSLARKIVPADRSVRDGGWNRSLGNSVYGKVLGVMGTGSIGSALAHMVSGLNMTILGYDLVQSDRFTSAGGEYVELHELFSRSDFISIHMPLTEKTHHFINHDRLEQMKPGAFLINTSRGGVIDETALQVHLQSGHLGGAALDVFEKEPPALGELSNFDQVVFTPHIGAYTHETLRKMDKTCITALSEALMDL